MTPQPGGQPTGGTGGSTATEDPTTRPVPTAADQTQRGSGNTSAEVSEIDEGTMEAIPLAAVGGLLAAGLLGGLAWRRRLQLQSRAVGRRIPHVPPAVRALAVGLGHRERPLSLRTLDRALRAIAAHCRNTGAVPPTLELALVSEREIELVMRDSGGEPPLGFAVRGRSWLLAPRDADYLTSIPGLSDAPRPYPALVTLGRDGRDRLVLADLESFGTLALECASPDVTGSIDSPDATDTPHAPERDDAADWLAAMAVELSFSPWAEEMILTLVGGPDRLTDALGMHNVTRTDDVDSLLERLEARAAAQREHRPVSGAQSAPHRSRSGRPLGSGDRPGAVSAHAGAAAATGRGDAERAAGHHRGGGRRSGSRRARWRLSTSSDSAGRAVLAPAGLALLPQRLPPPALDAVVELVATTGRNDTTPAPWWTAAEAEPDPPPDNVTYLGRRFGGWAPTNPEGGMTMTDSTVLDATAAEVRRDPMLQLLGPVELVGAAGSPPPRAAKQCLEYCGWLLEHPGSTARAMMGSLAVAEGTRRSNMSRLRTWLGEAPDGAPYLPEAYTGRIHLHPAVSSDWQRLQILTAHGVNRASDNSLRAALELIRGAPLADAAPGQWHWAEELRTDMISCVRDIGVELAERALAVNDLDLARRAAARALVAAPGDELLLAARIRTEHRAGNTAETERLTLQLAAQARSLGVDLEAETVALLQEVMEGRVRARLA